MPPKFDPNESKQTAACTCLLGLEVVAVDRH